MAIEDAAARGLIVLTYPGKSADWWRLPKMGLRLVRVKPCGEGLNAKPHNPGILDVDHR